MNQKQHFEIPTKLDPNETFGQKIEQLKSSMDAAQKISELKNEIEKKVPFEVFKKLVLEITSYSAKNLGGFLEKLQLQIELIEKAKATQKAREVLQKNSFYLELETRISKMHFAPDMPYQKAIYERSLFGLRNMSKILLTDELANFLEENTAADETKLAKLARAFIKEWFAKLAIIDSNDDGQLNYEELIPKNSEATEILERIAGSAPFFAAVRNNEFFNYREPNVEKHVTEKINFLKKYITNFSETLIDPGTEKPAKGAGLILGQLLQAISLEVVGGSFLRNQDLKRAWAELLGENEGENNVANVFNEGEEKHEQHEQEEFEKSLDKTSVQIRKERMKADEKMIAFSKHKEINPHDYPLRKFGDIVSLIYYYGSNILLATIGVNIVLSGFNPEKIVKNPVIWAMVAGLIGMKNHFSPDSWMSGASPIEKIEQEELKEKARAAPQAVQNWLMKFSKSDLDPKNGKLGKLLAEKNRSEITSDELADLLEEDERPNDKIMSKTQDARRLFLMFVACKQRDLSPKKLFNE